MILCVQFCICNIPGNEPSAASMVAFHLINDLFLQIFVSDEEIKTNSPHNRNHERNKLERL